MSELIDQKVGRYQIKELIGEGAMASVYRVYDPEIDRSLALKILKKDLSVDGEYLTRFLREAKAAGALSHSNILTVFDVGEYEKSPYILMELLEGSDLGDLLKKRKTISVRDTLIIALQLAKALNYAHDAGVIHRDIKPDNIMILEDGVSVKIADFGIARINENEDAQKTQVGSVLGTPRYMSPEQALGEEVDGRTDLYSVGVILYEMLSGEKAFDAANIGTLMTQIIQQQPTSLKQAYPDLPSGLCRIVQKLLHKKPDKRFQTGAELAKAISKELAVFNEQEENSKKEKYVPLKVRWTLYMATIVAFVMMVSVTTVFNIQSNAMQRQAIDSGSAFAKFIAIETAVPLLSEDWITLETFINEASSRGTFSYLVVTDRNGIVRGASDKSLVGAKYEVSDDEEVIEEIDGVITTESVFNDEEEVFNLQAPVLFQDIAVGQIVLGLSQDSLQSVKSVTGWLMFALSLITVLSVSAVLYVFGALITKPLRIVNESIQRVGEGDLDTRISIHRNDEIGEIVNSFNNMAHAIHQRIYPDELTESMIDERKGSPLDESLGASNQSKEDNKNSSSGSVSTKKDAKSAEGNSAKSEAVEKPPTGLDKDATIKAANTKKAASKSDKANTSASSTVKPATKPVSKANKVDIDSDDTDKTVIAKPKRAAAKPTATTRSKAASDKVNANKAATKPPAKRTRRKPTANTIGSGASKVASETEQNKAIENDKMVQDEADKTIIRKPAAATKKSASPDPSADTKGVVDAKDAGSLDKTVISKRSTTKKSTKD
ncbi:protein kinase domain-containing protein [Ningiella sp. W23]|uniref:protein kinase domain-containing protein n=1 Tax=Ningiella sp. W23 TaxID=3023715 RepID=UPI003756AFDE